MFDMFAIMQTEDKSYERTLTVSQIEELTQENTRQRQSQRNISNIISTSTAHSSSTTSNNSQQQHEEFSLAKSVATSQSEYSDDSVSLYTNASTKEQDFGQFDREGEFHQVEGSNRLTYPPPACIKGTCDV